MHARAHRVSHNAFSDASSRVPDPAVSPTLGLTLIAMAPPKHLLLACPPASFLGVVCLLARAALLATRPFSELVMEDSETSERTFLTNLLFHPWAAYVEALSQPVGQIAVWELLFVNFLYVTLSSIDASRIRARWGPLITVPILQLVAAAFGPTVSFSLLWLPSYLLAGNRDESAEVAKGDALSAGRFISCAIVIMIAHGSTVSVLACSHPMILIPHLIIFGILLGLTRLGPQVDHRTLKESWAVIGAFVVAETLFLWRLFTVAFLEWYPLFPAHLLSAVLTKEAFADYAATRYFAIELIAMTLSLAYLALLEDGWLVAVCTVSGALVLGPAMALAVYCVYRQTQIAEALKQLGIPDQDEIRGGRRIYDEEGAM